MKNINEPSSTEQQILEAAKMVFLEQGFAGARMQAIADKANINKAMLHYYFRSKKQLFDRIMSEVLGAITNNVISVLNAQGTVMEKVDHLIDRYTDTIIKNPHIPLFILNELSQNHVAFQEKLREKLTEENSFPGFIAQVMDEQAKGILKPFPPQHFLLTLMSLIVFPFIAKPVYTEIFSISEKQYIGLINQRRAIIKDIMATYFLA